MSMLWRHLARVVWPTGRCLLLREPGASLPKKPSAESFEDVRLDVFESLIDEVLIQRTIEVKGQSTYTSSLMNLCVLCL